MRCIMSLTHPEWSQELQTRWVSARGHSVCRWQVPRQPTGSANSCRPTRRPAGMHRGRWWSWCRSGRWSWSTLYTSAASPDSRQRNLLISHSFYLFIKSQRKTNKHDTVLLLFPCVWKLHFKQRLAFLIHHQICQIFTDLQMNTIRQQKEL